MLDTGLLLTGVLVWLVIASAARWAPLPVFDRTEILDRLVVPCLLGLLGGRLVAVILDDPASLGSLRSFLVIRGGVEFWPGVVVAVAALVWALRRQRRPIWLAIAELCPFLLWGYATYEAGCIVREGCYGPVSSIGLVPDGLRSRMFPVGLVVAVVVFGGGLAVHRLRSWTPRARVLLALGAVAAARSVASIWLPRLGNGPTRQHVESVAVVVAVAAAAIVAAAARRKPRHAPLGSTSVPVAHLAVPADTDRT